MKLKLLHYILILIIGCAISLGNLYAFAISYTEDVVINPGKLGIGVSQPKTALHVKAGPMPSGSDAVFFDKTRDPVNSVRYTFNDVGGLKTDAGGGAFWRGFQLGSPTITINGVNKFPRLTTFAEYDKLNDPTQKLWIIGTNLDHDMVYRINNQNILYLDDSGRVGIGTTTPLQKLDVAGNIRLTGNIVSPNDICIGTCP